MGEVSTAPCYASQPKRVFHVVGQGGLGLWGPRVALGFGGAQHGCCLKKAWPWSPGPPRRLSFPTAFKPFPPPLHTCQSPRVQGGETEGGSQSHPKQALDTIQASHRQGLHTQASLAPCLANETCFG